jgi:hypothetical protein
VSMPEPASVTPDEVKRLMEAEYRAATYIPLREAVAPYLISPFIRMLAWPDAAEPTRYPGWVIADLGSCIEGMTLAFSQFGYGLHGNPWGIVMSEQEWYGRDDCWFTCLEDAFINSGAWPNELPEEYEIR